MDIPLEERFTFLVKVMEGMPKRFTVTQQGDPESVANFKRYQPNRYAAYLRYSREEVYQ